MDSIKTGRLIRAARIKNSMTQLQLARKLMVSDKTVSKWERGCGCPDLSSLPLLAEILGLDISALLAGDLEENDKGNGNMKHLKLYVCPTCGNILFALGEAQVSCCGQKLTALQPQQADAGHAVSVEVTDGELYVTSAHEMTKAHSISFVALLTGDTLTVKKQYPEWGLETRLPFTARGTLLWYCTQHGLFYQDLRCRRPASSAASVK